MYVCMYSSFVSFYINGIYGLVLACCCYRETDILRETERRTVLFDLKSVLPFVEHFKSHLCLQLKTVCKTGTSK